jgi:hypothetical protein
MKSRAKILSGISLLSLIFIAVRVTWMGNGGT